MGTAGLGAAAGLAVLAAAVLVGLAAAGLGSLAAAGLVGFAAAGLAGLAAAGLAGLAAAGVSACSKCHVMCEILKKTTFDEKILTYLPLAMIDWTFSFFLAYFLMQLKRLRKIMPCEFESQKFTLKLHHTNDTKLTYWYVLNNCDVHSHAPKF